MPKSVTTAGTANSLVPPNSKGFAALVQNGTGKYTLTLGTLAADSTKRIYLDTYHHSLNVVGLWDATGNSGTAPLAPLIYRSLSSIGTAGTFQIVTTNVAQAATNPAAGEKLYLKVILCNSNTVS